MSTATRRRRKYGPLNPGDTMVPQSACASRPEAELMLLEFAKTLRSLGRTAEAGVYVNKMDDVFYAVYVHRYEGQRHEHVG